MTKNVLIQMKVEVLLVLFKNLCVFEILTWLRKAPGMLSVLSSAIVITLLFV